MNDPNDRRGRVPRAADATDPLVLLRMIDGLAALAGVVGVVVASRDAESEDDVERLAWGLSERVRAFVDARPYKTGLTWGEMRTFLTECLEKYVTELKGQ